MQKLFIRNLRNKLKMSFLKINRIIFSNLNFYSTIFIKKMWKKHYLPKFRRHICLQKTTLRQRKWLSRLNSLLYWREKFIHRWEILIGGNERTVVATEDKKVYCRRQILYGEYFSRKIRGSTAGCHILIITNIANQIKTQPFASISFQHPKQFILSRKN